ncbi:hypothetical protein PGB90_002289 [Kerria lacca]
MFKEQPIIAYIRGVQCLNNNASMANVLYGKIVPNPILHNLVKEIVYVFNDSGNDSINYIVY